MKKLSREIVAFFENQGYVIVSTIDKKGCPHNSCKGIVKINKNGSLYLLDLYKSSTYKNIIRNPRLNVTAVDEHNFAGYCLKGKAKIVSSHNLRSAIISIWNKKMTNRIAHRLIRNVQGQKGALRNPEAFLPRPQYLIVMRIESVVDLTPPHIKKGGSDE